MLRGAEKLVPAEYWCPYGTCNSTIKSSCIKKNGYICLNIIVYSVLYNMITELDQVHYGVIYRYTPKEPGYLIWLTLLYQSTPDMGKHIPHHSYHHQILASFKLKVSPEGLTD